MGDNDTQVLLDKNDDEFTLIPSCSHDLVTVTSFLKHVTAHTSTFTVQSPSQAECQETVSRERGHTAIRPSTFQHVIKESEHRHTIHNINNRWKGLSLSLPTKLDFSDQASPISWDLASQV